MSGFRVLVADDEPLARRMIATLLRDDAEIEAVIECDDASTAGTLIEHARPDILFLDIEMPTVSGLEIARGTSSGCRPIIVFVTAFSHYATQAFAVEASDYVVKPFSDQRFAAALERAKRRVRERRLGTSAIAAGPAIAVQAPAPQARVTALTLRDGHRTIILTASDIIWIEAEDYYVRIHSTHGRHLVRMSLASLEMRLEPHRFLRVHRAAIVNTAAVRAVRGGPTLTLQLVNGAEVLVSRARRGAVEAALPPGLKRGYRSFPDGETPMSNH